jgi:RNA polymerase sigma-70 factor (ECF subfamily)
MRDLLTLTPNSTGSRLDIFHFSDFFDFFDVRSDVPPEIKDLRTRGFGLWVALSSSEGHSRGEIMLGQFPNRSKRGLASLRDSAADEELVAATRSGDELAFESLFKRHRRRIFALAFRYTGVREDAEDIVQQTFQKAFVHLHEFEGKSSFSTWATRIAINQALMSLRTRRALREVPMDDSSSDQERTPLPEPTDASPDPEASCSQKERAGILSAAMRQLRPGMRRAIHLKEMEELSAGETAVRMGVSVGTVKARVFHARRKLGKALSHYMSSRRVSRSSTSVVAECAGRSSQNRLT